MKKILSILLCVCFLLTVVACGNDEAADSGSSGMENSKSEISQSDASKQPESKPEESDTGSETESEQSSDEDETSSGSNILVAYFSLAGEQYEVGVIEKGNTEIIAEMIADATGADTFKIESTEEYPTTYDGLLDISRKEEEDPPEIAGMVDNMDNYDTIFLGYPIWWGDTPTIIKVFLQSYDFSGKTICSLITHGGSGFSNSLRDIARLCPGAKITEGLAINGDNAATCDKDLEKWVKKIGLK